MRVFVTGADGFVGRWLQRELDGARHEVIPSPTQQVLDIADQLGVLRALSAAQPDAVIHLAAVAFAGDASADPAEAIRVNVGGTLAILEACRAQAARPVLLVVGTSEVYAAPTTSDPLREASRLGPRGVYGLTKLAAEALALAASIEGVETAVVRSFNHTGPGQRTVFAVPAFATRILAARAEGRHDIRAGNVDVARDIGDVRDVVRAYRVLVEALAEGRVTGRGRVYNVASGRAVSIRAVIDRLAELAGWPVTIVHDPSLVRTDDPPIIVGDARALHELTGWAPMIDLDQTLADVLASLD